MQFSVNQEISLIDALTHWYPDSSRTTLRSWIAMARVSVDNSPATKPHQLLKKGQTVSIGSRKKATSEGLQILFSDPHLVVINKPPRLLSVATDMETKNTAHAFLKNHYYPKKVYIVHRLDQDTSGVMLFALKGTSRDLLKRLLEKHEVQRKYIAIVEGHFEQKAGTWKSHLYEDKNYHVRVTDDPERGKLAITHYKVEKSFSSYSLLSINLETGRKNQIRVHCSQNGHPVIGDIKYGATTDPIRRLGLHAYQLCFTHPITGKEMNFTAPPPPPFQNFLERYHA